MIELEPVTYFPDGTVGLGLAPWDERYDRGTGEYTCPCCLRRMEAAEGHGDELGHLCNDCWHELHHYWPTVATSGLRWSWNSVLEEWQLSCRGMVATIRRGYGEWIVWTRDTEFYGPLGDCARWAVSEANRHG